MRNIEVIPALRQQAWGWPALANFILGGIGAGLYLVCFLTDFFQNGLLSISNNTTDRLLGPLTTILGFAALGLEAGRPFRALYLLRNMRSSSLSKETFLWACFIVTAILDWAVPHPVIRVIAITSAVAFIFSQGFVVYQIRAIRNWHQPVLPVFFMSSGLASGYGFALLIGAIQNFSRPLEMMAVGMTSIFANALIWIIYLFLVCSGSGTGTADDLCHRPLLNMLIVGIGHIIPLCGFWLWSQRTPDYADWGQIVQAAIGLAILMGVIIQKKTIVLDAAIVKKISIAAADN